MHFYFTVTKKNSLKFMSLHYYSTSKKDGIIFIIVNVFIHKNKKYAQMCV